MRVTLITVVIIFFLSGCYNSDKGSDNNGLPLGIWRGIITMQERELPFNFEMGRNSNDQYQLTLMNGDERILVDDIEAHGDSLFIPMHIFDTQLKVHFDGEKLSGVYVKNYVEGYILPFIAYPGQSHRFQQYNDATIDMTGRYQVYFLDENDSSEAVGIFTQEENRLTGTFLTPTGDYRYLEGIVDRSDFYLSTFDGEHTYLFSGSVGPNGSLTGNFKSGRSWDQSWVGLPDATASLPDPNTMTYLKEGYDRIDFNLPNMDGKMVSLNDPRYNGNVVIVQIFGSWCANCMDETKFLSSWYDKNKSRGVEIVALAFERKDDFNYAKSRIDRMVSKYNIDYEFLFAGPSIRGEVLKVLPMLNQFRSYPTTIFIDKKGIVRRIHTGFSGPGTGDAYASFIEDFNVFMDKLLEE